MKGVDHYWCALNQEHSIIIPKINQDCFESVEGAFLKVVRNYLRKLNPNNWQWPFLLKTVVQTKIPSKAHKTPFKA
ncbi:MAG: hypothetical protein ACRBFS_08320 [Aureispira sp.]